MALTKPLCSETETREKIIESVQTSAGDTLREELGLGHENEFEETEVMAGRAEEPRAPPETLRKCSLSTKGSLVNPLEHTFLSNEGGSRRKKVCKKRMSPKLKEIIRRSKMRGKVIRRAIEAQEEDDRFTFSEGRNCSVPIHLVYMNWNRKIKSKMHYLFRNPFFDA